MTMKQYKNRKNKKDKIKITVWSWFNEDLIDLTVNDIENLNEQQIYDHHYDKVVDAIKLLYAQYVE